MEDLDNRLKKDTDAELNSRLQRLIGLNDEWQ